MKLENISSMIKIFTFSLKNWIRKVNIEFDLNEISIKKSFTDIQGRV